MKTLLVMAGGTGGHIFPALAVARKLQKQDYNIIWLGTKDRMEAQIIPNEGIDIEFIEVRALRGKGILSLFTAPFMIVKAIYQAIKVMKKVKPDAVLGMGGYICGPGGVAAKLCGIPLILHEQNAVAGLTNKLLNKIATKTLQAFDGAFENAKVVGNPVREDICAITSRALSGQNNDEIKHILVMGGSQGARIINQTLPKVAHKFNGKAHFYHQVGRGNLASTQKDYDEYNTQNVTLVEFIDDVAKAYQNSDLVIARSGAMTVCELQAVGLGAIFVPFNHKDRQQFLNAKAMQDCGGCIILEGDDFNEQNLFANLSEILTASKCQTMGQIMKDHAIMNATKRIADEIQQL